MMNRFLKLKFLLTTAFIIIGCGLHASCPVKTYGITINDTLKNIIKVAFDSNLSKLFVHYDKNVYLPNETIWFTAYRPGYDGTPGGPDVLSVALVKNNDRTIAAHKKFVVTGIASSGNMLVPDSIAAGDYTLIAYTNHFVKGRPDELFLQRIAVKRLDPQTAQTSKATVPVRPTAGNIDAKFYPEGGDLVAGLPTYVGWEVKDGAGAPIALKALLLQDGKFADTIRTAASGMGRFFIRPKYGSRYEIKIIDKNEQPAIALPAIAPNGVALTIPSAVVRDTVVVKVAGNMPGSIHIVVHNLRKVFYILNDIRPGSGQIFKLALDSLPRGLAAITVYGENMQPYAERTFYAHYQQAPPLLIKPDQATYGKRKKVTLHLDFNSTVSQQGVVSIACVRTNRLDRNNFNDIESFAYLEHSINGLPFPVSDAGRSADARKYLEDMLLVKGWRRYIVDYPPADTSTQFGGFITIRDKAAKKPKMLILFGDFGSKLVSTDAKGNFTISNADLLSNRAKSLTLMGTGLNTEDLKISWIDPYEKINHDIAMLIAPEEMMGPLKFSLQNNEPSILESKIRLNPVTIKSKRDDEYGQHKPLNSNACGDYVCEEGFFNCERHRDFGKRHPPIKGHVYLSHSRGTITYWGCSITNQSTIHFDGINVKKEFYPYGDADITLSEPLYENTLYWKNQLNLEKGKEATVAFYTGDIKAGFSIIVQGVADNEVIFGQQHFEVE